MKSQVSFIAKFKIVANPAKNKCLNPCPIETLKNLWYNIREGGRGDPFYSICQYVKKLRPRLYPVNILGAFLANNMEQKCSAMNILSFFMYRGNFAYE